MWRRFSRNARLMAVAVAVLAAPSVARAQGQVTSDGSMWCGADGCVSLAATQQWSTGEGSGDIALLSMLTYIVIWAFFDLL